MKKGIHVHYLNPTIIEAVVEIRFAQLLTLEDNEKIEKKFGSHYTLKKDELNIYNAEFNPTGMSLKHDKPGYTRLIVTLENQILVQIYPDKFSFHWVGKYPGGDKFHEKFKGFWTKFCKALPGVMGQQVGIRYINKLDQKTVDQPIGYWLKSSANYPKNILKAKSNYFFRGKWPLGKNRFAQLSIAEAEIRDNLNPLILDIDVIQQMDKPLKLEPSFFKIVIELHDEVYDIFSSSISSNYKKVLNTKPGNI